MVWLLPLIIIGGLFFPVLGYFVIAMMAFFLPLSFFKGRFWCWSLCPRGAFLDIVMSKATPNRAFPKTLTKISFRWFVLALFMVFLVYRMLQTGGNILAIGAVFVSMCILTTIIAIIIALVSRHRGWCLICPMGTLQEQIGKIKKKKSTNL
ncbi:MAG: 4Fe-4S binding protein [Candidatus Omnitrophica bacterium]|jgi:polyferredoxin|nr:4Fe-4S binding protein [Candidatus Omnitrophota bacterium]